MKKIFLAALTVLSLGAGAANAMALYHGPYDNTGQGPREIGLGCGVG
jgi:hypothetical protein